MNWKVGLLGLVALAVVAGASSSASAEETKTDPKKDPKIDPDPKVDPVDPKVDPKVDPPKPDPKPGPVINPKPVDPKIDPKPVDPVNPKAAEAEACAWSLANRPGTYLDLKRGADDLPLWLTKVAYRRVRDTGPVPPVAPADLAIFGRLAQCIAAGLANDNNQNPPNQTAEAAACAWALAERPNVYADLVRGDETLSLWLTKIAYRRVRGTGPVPPSDLADLAIFGRLTQCIAAGLAAPPPSAGIDAKNLTGAEKALLDELAVTRPSQFLSAPQPDLQNRGTRKLADWLANVALWRIYTSPESAWVKSGKAPAPWVLPANSPWSAVWLRMRDYLISIGVANLAPKFDVDQPADPNTTTSTERTAAVMVWKDKPQTYPNAPTAAMQSRGARSQEDWAANYVYWYLYADPKAGGPTYAGAPWVVGNDPKWAPVWKRIRAFIGELP